MAEHKRKKKVKKIVREVASEKTVKRVSKKNVRRPAKKKLVKEKAGMEEKAMHEMTDDLPFGDWVYALWREYEDQVTIEAKFVKALDRIEGFLHIAEVGVKAYIPKEFHADYATKAVVAFDEATHHFPELKDLLEEVKKDLKQQFEKVGVKWLDSK